MTYLFSSPKLAVFPGSSTGQRQTPVRRRWQARPVKATFAPTDADGCTIAVDRSLPRSLRRDGWWLES